MTYKVIDAINGQVTKFEYDGAEYVAVEGREAGEGDFVVFTESPSVRLDDNKPYEIKRIDSFGDPHIRSNDEDLFDTVDEDFKVYEKVAPPQPETITHEGREYTLVDRKAQAGGCRRVR